MADGGQIDPMCVLSVCFKCTICGDNISIEGGVSDRYECPTCATTWQPINSIAMQISEGPNFAHKIH